MSDKAMFEVFGGDQREFQQEAEQRWGETDAWVESRNRTARYTKQDWEDVKAESEAIMARIAEVYRSGAAPESEAAMDAVDAHRLRSASDSTNARTRCMCTSVICTWPTRGSRRPTRPWPRGSPHGCATRFAPTPNVPRVRREHLPADGSTPRFSDDKAACMVAEENIFRAASSSP